MNEALQPLRLILGGTFDPPHIGHLSLAMVAADHFRVPVWLLPNGNPRHRDDPRLSADRRAELIELAIAGDERLRLDRRELARDVSGYSVDTLEQLRREMGSKQPIAWLLGADSFRDLHHWHGWERLGDLTHWVVVERPGSVFSELPDPLARWAADRWTADPLDLSRSASGRLYRLPHPPRDVSSSAIRARLAQGDPCSDVLSPAVAGRIRELGLYR